MKTRLLSGLCGLLFVGGCVSSPAAHFVPGPPLPIPKPITAEAQVGLAGGTGVNMAWAQTFTASAEGFLTEVDVGTQRQSMGNNETSHPPLLLEIRTLRGELPDMSSTGLKFAGTIPFSALPGAGSMEGGMIRTDLSRYRIHVAKDERLAIVESPSDDAWLQIQIVFGHTYSGGELYEFEDGNWQMQPNQSQFRAYADAGLASTTSVAAGSQPSTTSASAAPPDVTLIRAPIPPHGNPIAQCVPRPRTMGRSIHQPVVAGEWQFRTTIFKDAGSYYLELTTFNGTNRRAFGFAQNGPITITLSKVGSAAGQVVFPPKQNGYIDNRFSQLQLPGPGEGTVRQYKLNDSATPLVSGTYVISIVYPEQISDHAITATLVVP